MARDSLKGKEMEMEMETDEFITRSDVRPFCKQELEFALNSQHHVLDLPRTLTRPSINEKKPRKSVGFSMNPPTFITGEMTPPMMHYQADQSHSYSSSHELSMALCLSTPTSKSETPVLEECGKSLLKKMMASASLSLGSMEVDFPLLTGIESQQNEAVMMNPNLKMFRSFLSMDLQNNQRDHFAPVMLDRKCSQYVASQQPICYNILCTLSTLLVLSPF